MSIGGPFINQGWQCPVCGYVYSPITPCCYNCNRPDHEKYTVSTGTDTEATKIIADSNTEDNDENNTEEV